MADESVLTKQSSDFPRWYQEVIAQAELAENGPVRGTMVIRPYGYAIWELMQAELDRRIKQAGVPNAYFPLFIPESFLRREEEHVEGFKPELAVVTHGGGKRLEEPVVVRPTSETVINSFFAKWIQSHRDLPMAVNQWANVVRWELRPRLFLRTSEFLWQEGHTAHATAEEARSFALRILHEVYADFFEEVLRVPVALGRKTTREKFAGAECTWTAEAMMRDGKALQMGTSHELGQNFSRVFDITFLDASGERRYAWQTSWGASTRLIGALIMVHGDDFGLRLPSKVAPWQVVAMLVREDERAAALAKEVCGQLSRAGLRIHLDQRTEVGFGRRSVDWELKGVPLRLEVGPRDAAAGEVVVVNRAERKKTTVPADQVAAYATAELEAIDAALFAEARSMLMGRTQEVQSAKEALEAAQDGFAVIPEEALGSQEEDLLNQAGITVRCITERSFMRVDQDGKSVDPVALVGRAY